MTGTDISTGKETIGFEKGFTFSGESEGQKGKGGGEELEKDLPELEMISSFLS